MKTESKYPVGATWERFEDGKRGLIWLAEVRDSVEVWRWNVMYEDGSGLKFDWAPSYNLCRQAIPIYGRFKRVK